MNRIIAVAVILLSVATAKAAPIQPSAVEDATKTGGSQKNSVVATNPEPLTLENAIRTALLGSPGLRAIQTRVKALAQIPAQQGALPDPNLSLRILNLPIDSFAVGQEGMTQLQLGLAQTFPFPGKLALLAAVAEDQASMAGYDVSEWQLRLVRDIRKLWWRLAYLDRAIDIVTANQDLLRQFLNVAQTKYRVGRGLQQDVLLAQLELSRLIERSLVLHNERQSEEARLNTLMGVSVGDNIRLPKVIDESLPPVTTLAELRKMARESRPRLKGNDAAIAMAEAKVELARKDYYPDLVFSAGYGIRSGSNPDGSGRADLLSLGASINLPIFTSDRQDRQLDQYQKELLTRRFQKQDTQNRIEDEVTEAYQDYQLSREQVRLFNEGIIPQATQTVASMRSGYEVSKVDFLNLIRAQITLFDYQIRYWQTQSQAHEALARLMAAIGKESYQ